MSMKAPKCHSDILKVKMESPSCLRYLSPHSQRNPLRHVPLTSIIMVWNLADLVLQGMIELIIKDSDKAFDDLV